MSNNLDILIANFYLQTDSGVLGFLNVSSRLNISDIGLLPVGSVDIVPSDEIISANNPVPFAPPDDSEYMVALLMHRQQEPFYFVAAVGKATFDRSVFDENIFG